MLYGVCIFVNELLFTLVHRLLKKFLLNVWYCLESEQIFSILQRLAWMVMDAQRKTKALRDIPTTLP